MQLPDVSRLIHISLSFSVPDCCELVLNDTRVTGYFCQEMILDQFFQGKATLRSCKHERQVKLPEQKLTSKNVYNPFGGLFANTNLWI